MKTKEKKQTESRNDVLKENCSPLDLYKKKMKNEQIGSEEQEEMKKRFNELVNYKD